MTTPPNEFFAEKRTSTIELPPGYTELPPGVIGAELLHVDNIEATAATQVRVRLDRGVIDQYTDDIQNGAVMPPVDVYREENSERNILADGFHRHRAYINAEHKEMWCWIYPGGTHEALIHALGSNAEHGHRRSRADKRHAVEMALKDPELGALTMKEIADVCRVHRNTVRKIQNEHLAGDDDAHNVQDEKHSRKPEDPTDDDIRDNGADVTQGDIDLEELRTAVKTINTMPYNGTAAADKLDLTKDDIADCELASTWLADVVILTRNREAEETPEREPGSDDDI